jgi:hypothetical protein
LLIAAIGPYRHFAAAQQSIAFGATADIRQSARRDAK